VIKLRHNGRDVFKGFLNRDQGLEAQHPLETNVFVSLPDAILRPDTFEPGKDMFKAQSKT
jgi:hypothetical protein